MSLPLFAYRPIVRRLSLLCLLALVVLAPEDAWVAEADPGAEGHTPDRVRAAEQAAAPIEDPARVVGGSPTDSDGDGIADADEMLLGTDPGNVDTDCDGKDDSIEIVNVLAPLDADGDGLIDAVESRWVDSDTDGLKDDVDVHSGDWQFACGRFIPFAVQDDESDSTRLEVNIVGGSGITDVVIDTLSFFTDVRVDGIDIPTLDGIQLFDDGTEGDRIAGDGIFTRDGITSASSTSSIREREFDKIRVTADEVTLERDLDALIGFSFDRIKLGIVDPSLVQQPVPVAPGARIVDNAVNLVDPQQSAVVRRYLMGDIGFTPQNVSLAFYEFAPDEFDWLLVFPAMTAVRGNFGVAVQIKNDTQGIGQTPFDATAGWGSDGRLGSVVARNWDNSGPTLHELLHRFAVDLSPSLGFQNCTGGHWGVAGVGEGQLGGFDPSTLVDNMDGTYTVESFSGFANGGDSVPYAPIELYVAGLIPSEEVPDMTMPQTLNCGSLSCNSTECTFAASGLATTTIDDVIAFHGARVPDAAVSQKSFATATLVVSQYELNGAEMAFFAKQSSDLGLPTLAGSLYSFEEATGGRATMNTTFDTTPVYRSSSPVDVVDPSNRAGAAFGSPFEDVPPAATLLYYKVDDGAGLPAEITLELLSSGNVRISWP